MIRKKTTLVLAAFLFPIVIAMLFYTILPDPLHTEESTDFKWFYGPVAENLTKGKGFCLNGKPAVRYPPGYPLILAGVFKIEQYSALPRTTLLRVMIVLSYGIASVFLYLLAHTFKSPRNAFLTCAVWSVYPPWLWMTKQSNSEMPFAVFFYAGVWLIWNGLNQDKRKLLLLLSGVLVGFTALIRPSAVGLSIVVPLFVFWYLSKEKIGQKLIDAVLVFIGFCLVVAPWQVWLNEHVDGFALLSTGGVPSIRDGLTFAEAPKGYRQSTDMPEDVAQLMNRALGRKQSGRLENLGDIVDFLISEGTQNPITFAKLYAIKAVRSWYATDSGRYEIPILLSQIPFFILIAMGIFTHLRYSEMSPGLLVLLFGIVLYFWMMTILVLSIVRYMLPAIGLLFILIPNFEHLLKLFNLDDAT